MNSRTLHRPAPAILALLCLALAGCAVQFVSRYDEFTDRALHDLHIRTNEFIARASATRATYAESVPFYEEAKATVRAIRTRAELQADNQNEINQLVALEDQFERLEAKHRLGPLRPSLAGSLELGFRKLIRIQLAKKRSVRLLRESSPSPAA